ncbi:hypothetical protein FOXB_01655 [Fusarium oxysporum f. sp. conglutinans Fo5176]|uniref:Heterokaryon incompatibility domain-containing protein n=1 Tax=Fusarium oxysporum (strain Fo5176) TaxID=660025 RepID=F9F5I0_FUSOF|nr:hypothetical protein FOXB_01655 [Fusarium oxysporum f. sp. conglutinans Fo5176]KAG7001289.1 Heterokaryon incompatibility protein 6, OR allele [Fusarium oxysporum f. sp. conglutinans]KAI8417110.1 hypothetical protein FOFC_03423 [Fusarium oxysporum]
MDLPTYDYEPLDANSTKFRLIKLRPARYQPKPGNLPSDDIYCTIMTVDLINPPRYEALSYCWGKPVFTHRVVVELDNRVERQIRITESLHEALRQIRDPSSDLVVYIDQLCINQAAVAEKNRQVELMGGIYSQSCRVLAWLGPATSASDAFVDFITDSDSGHGDSNKGCDQELRSLMDIEDLGQELDQLIFYASKAPYTGFLDFVSRQWYWRMWIIQEACLGREVVFICGSKRCCIDCVEHFLFLLSLSINIRSTMGLTVGCHRKWAKESSDFTQLTEPLIHTIQDHLMDNPT